MPETKLCRTCGFEKPVEEFYAKGVLASGNKRYRADCIPCTIAALDANPAERERIRAATAGWRAEDPVRGRKSCTDSRNRHLDERHAATHEARYDPIRRPVILAQARGSYQRNREQRIAYAQAWDAAHPGYRATYGSAYWKKRPDKGREHRDKRRARLAGVEGSYTEADVQAMWDAQGGLCANPYCCADLDVVGYAVDHRVPLVRGGRNDPSNLHLLCHPKKGRTERSCNSRKRDKDWIRFLRDYAKADGLPWPPPGMTDLEDAA